MKYSRLLIVFFLICLSCKKDDDNFMLKPPRDRAEVYAEDILEIETFLKTHFYNYEAVDANNPYSEANDTFQIVFDTIAGANANKTPLIEQVETKIVTDAEDIEYVLYYLNVREGKGKTINFSDKAFVTYQGMLLNGKEFDSAVTPLGLTLSAYSNPFTNQIVPGVVTGFMEALINFRGAEGFTENLGQDGTPDGTVSYYGHGIGAVFIPSGLAYFSNPTASIPSYTPITFTFSLKAVEYIDYENDLVFTYLEDIDNDKDVFNDDTDADALPNAYDTDDDGDETLTKDELDYKTYTYTDDSEPVLAANEYEYSRETFNGKTTIKTVLIRDSNNDGTPDYLDNTIK